MFHWGDAVTRPRAACPALAAALLLAGAVRADFNCNVGVDFYESGPLRSCVLNGDHRLYAESGEALICANGGRAQLHRDGTLASCILSRPARLQERECAAGSRVEFAADGRLLQCKKNESG